MPKASKTPKTHGPLTHGGETLGSGDYIPSVAGHPDGVSIVAIPAGTSTIQLSSEFDELRVDGTLTLDPAVNVALKITTLLVSKTGKLVSRPNPGITHVVTFADKPLADNDLESITHGMLVLGETDIEGEAKTPTARLTANLAIGATTIKLDAVPADWKIGDELIIPDTSNYGSQRKYNQRERRKIKTIAAGIVTVDPLTFAHEGIKDYLGKIVKYPPIANLTRSVVFKSEKPIGMRAHGFFGESAKTSIKNAAFQNMGRTDAMQYVNSTVRTGEVITWKGTNQNGRYPIHLHHAHTPATISGCVVDGSLKWGIAIHNSHDNIITKNVVVDCVGAGIVTEDGNESNNKLVGNYILGCNGAGTFLATRGGAGPVKMELIGGVWQTKSDIGHEGVCLWMHGQNNFVTDNILINGVGVGTTTWTRLTGDQKLSFPNGVTGSPRDFVFPDFSGNEIWYCGGGLLFDGVAPKDVVKLRNNSFYGLDSGGVNISYSGSFEFDGLTIIGLDHGHVTGFAHEFMTKVTGKNWNIQRMMYGAALVTNFDISDSFFANASINVMINCSNGALATPIITGVLRNIKHAKAPITIGCRWWPQTGLVGHIAARDYYVYDHNGVAGDNFKVMMTEQGVGVLPSSGMGDSAITTAHPITIVAGTLTVPGTVRLVPEALTNAELFAKYGIAMGGRVATSKPAKTGIQGIVAPIPTDTQWPIISGISVEYLTPTSVKVKWKTDKPCNTALEYDHDQVSDLHFGLFAKADNALTLDHAITLTGLLPNTLYAFRPYATDGAGNCTEWPSIGGGSQFGRTLPVFHTGQILSAQHLYASEMTASTATVQWFTTTDAATCIEYIKYATNVGALRTPLDSGGFIHGAKITGLVPKQAYSMKVLNKTGQAISGPSFFTTL